jgi:hypothetical protein
MESVKYVENSYRIIVGYLVRGEIFAEYNIKMSWKKSCQAVVNWTKLANNKAYYFYYQYSAFGPVLAGTRAQSDDRYVSGWLRSRQVHRGSLPLLSPAFRRSNFRCKMPPRPQQRERS